MEEITPQSVGKLCIQALFLKRQHQLSPGKSPPEMLFLAGKKTTPPLSDNPESLQTGQWGVDLVETASASSFLRQIGWLEKTANQDEDQVFKIELI